MFRVTLWTGFSADMDPIFMVIESETALTTFPNLPTSEKTGYVKSRMVIIKTNTGGP